MCNTKCNNVVQRDNNVVLNNTISKSSNYQIGSESMGTTEFNENSSER